MSEKEIIISHIKNYFKSMCRRGFKKACLTKFEFGTYKSCTGTDSYIKKRPRCMFPGGHTLANIASLGQYLPTHNRHRFLPLLLPVTRGTLSKCNCNPLQVAQRPAVMPKVSGPRPTTFLARKLHNSH
jgi:hypothetical protein